MASSFLPITFRIEEPGKPSKDISFCQKTIKMGRGTRKSLDIQIDDPAVSRVQAIINVKQSDAFLMDMSSSTKINGKKAGARTKLEDGTIIQAGNTTITFFVTSQMPASEQTEPAGQPKKASSTSENFIQVSSSFFTEKNQAYQTTVKTIPPQIDPVDSMQIFQDIPAQTNSLGVDESTHRKDRHERQEDHHFVKQKTKKSLENSVQSSPVAQGKTDPPQLSVQDPPQQSSFPSISKTSVLSPNHVALHPQEHKNAPRSTPNHAPSQPDVLYQEAPGGHGVAGNTAVAPGSYDIDYHYAFQQGHILYPQHYTATISYGPLGPIPRTLPNQYPKEDQSILLDVAERLGKETWYVMNWFW